MLGHKPPVVSETSWFLKSVKTPYIPSNSLLYLRKYLINQNKIDIFMIRKNLSFCNIKSRKFSCSFNVVKFIKFF